MIPQVTASGVERIFLGCPGVELMGEIQSVVGKNHFKWVLIFHFPIYGTRGLVS